MDSIGRLPCLTAMQVEKSQGWYTRFTPGPPNIVLVGESDLIRDIIAGGLRDAEYEVAVASIDEVEAELPLPGTAGGLPSIDLLVVEATGAPREALALIEEVRAIDTEIPIVVLASEAVYFDLWPHTADLGVLACFTLPVDLRAFVAIMGELVP